MNTEARRTASVPRYLAPCLCGGDRLPGRADRVVRAFHEDLQSMRTLDWVVLVASLVFVVGYGLWRGRGSDTDQQISARRQDMPWYAMALSIMATQASAITFISTTGQSYVDGMRFVQFYFGLPIAMVILSATAVPIFHRANVYTAYEYLEHASTPRRARWSASFS